MTPKPLDAALARSVLEGFTDGIAISNRMGELVYMNPAGARLVGLGLLDGPPAEWSKGYGVFQVDGKTPFHPEELPVFRALAGEGEASVTPTEIEVIVRNEAVPDGVRLAVAVKLLKDEAGKLQGSVVIYRNVTDRWRTREELKQRETYLYAILDNLPDIAWLKDRESRFVAVNATLARAAGRPASELIGKTDLDVWPRELAEHYRSDDAEIMAARSTKRLEEPLVRSDGTVRVIETIKTAIVDEAGVVIGTTGIARDITERKHAEEALRGSKEELERRIVERTRELERAQEVSVRKERLAVLGQLAGGVAHQIRNPLAAIKNATYVLERSLPLVGVAVPPLEAPVLRRSSPLFGERGPDGTLHPTRLTLEQQVAQSLAIIHEEIRRANDIISGLLDYARTRAPVRQNVTARTLMTQSLALEEIPEAIHVNMEPGPCELVVDPGQVQEALHILVRNAIDAMPDGGTLSITCEEDDDGVVIAVEDTGVGVPPDVEGRLFEPLLTTKPMGLGLGLVTARTLVEAQGGQLVFVPRASRGAASRGARFELRFSG